MARLTCQFFSDALGVSTTMEVLLPQPTGSAQIGMDGAPRRDAYPVLYLLHGWSDDESIWMRRTSIERYASELGLVIVMPRVELSYYQNMATGMNYWDFISEEVPRLCAAWFPVSRKREDTYAAGLSMGGYGAFRLGLALPERFGAVASLSGALDVAGIRNKWRDDAVREQKLEAIWGRDLQGFSDEMDLLCLARRVASGKAPAPRLYQWCGTEDFLYDDNIRFRDHARKVGLELDYHESTGDHAWGHWDREIQAVLKWLNP